MFKCQTEPPTTRIFLFVCTFLTFCCFTESSNARFYTDKKINTNHIYNVHFVLLYCIYSLSIFCYINYSYTLQIQTQHFVKSTNVSVRWCKVQSVCWVRIAKESGKILQIKKKIITVCVAILWILHKKWTMPTKKLLILWRVEQFLPLTLICQQTSRHSPTAMGDHL